ncbi:hypothetical protein [Tropicimonas sp. S265A]|uniref:hypothetical protein n=1 Tax=Tropicimonas sp. S265A TaxID=3415134 RepID=UPI003C7AFC40
MPPIDPDTLLAGADAAISRSEQTADTIARATRHAPLDIDIRLAAYRFYFYTHDFRRAAEEARVILAHTARQLNIPQDWALVSAQDAPFTEHRFQPGLYLQALIGWGYCLARMGDLDGATAVWSKAAKLDPTDRFGGAWLLDRIKAHEDEDA